MSGARREQPGVDDAGARPGPPRRPAGSGRRTTVPAGRNSFFMRSSSGTTWSFHAAHSISAIVVGAVPLRDLGGPPVDAELQVRARSTAGTSSASASFEKSVKRRSARYGPL